MCRQCQIKPVYEFTNKRKVCRNCFIRWFEKRALYTIRKFNMLNKRDVVGYKKKDDFLSVVLEEILNLIAEKGFVRIIRLPAHPRSQIDKDLINVKNNRAKRARISKIALPITTDLTAYEIINELINGNIKNLNKFLPVYKKTIKPLYLFLDKEIFLYAKLKKLKFRKIKTKGTKISKFIDELEKKHPEIKRAIVNGFLKLYG